MNDDLKYIMAMTCVLPAATGIYKYNNIHKRFHPFIYMMILDVVMETTFYLVIKFPRYAKITPVAVNLYMQLNFGLFLYFVYINKYINKNTIQALFAITLLVVLFNYIYFGSIFKTFFYLLCFVSAGMLIISIDILSRQIMVIKLKLVNNPWFWISSCSIIYNAFTLLIFGLYFVALFNTPNGKAIGIIQHFVNAGCYIFFAFAIIKMPAKN
ncbi:MAG: hypothetical protein WKI04_02365 [Ferruginibacter sp.]